MRLKIKFIEENGKNWTISFYSVMSNLCISEDELLDTDLCCRNMNMFEILNWTFVLMVKIGQVITFFILCYRNYPINKREVYYGQEK